jgi:uncharacterized protein (TIGR02594 family)
MDRRAFVACLPILAVAARGAESLQVPAGAFHYDYPFFDYYDPSRPAPVTGSNLAAPFGNVRAPQADIDTATMLTNAAPTTSALAILSYFAALTETGTMGEAFNARWQYYGNPVIVRFFHDIGYQDEKYPDADCTPWCAAALSWAFKRSGVPIPPNPVSSQSYLGFGKTVTEPSAGDVAVFTSIQYPGRGHVGLYLSGNAGTINVLGGNQADLKSGPTDCGPNYPRSKIFARTFNRNSARDLSVSSLYLNAIVRLS